MAIVTRYFSTTGAGAADGTTWADRAALFSAGNWSSVVTGFAFNSTDALRCLIGPGSYTCSQTLATGLFANAPTVGNPLWLHSCDNAGAVLAPPAPGWTSDQPAFDDSTLPVIATTTNVATSSLAAAAWRLLKLTATGRTSGSVIGGAFDVDWCVITTSAAASGVLAASAVTNTKNSVLSVTGSQYSAVVICANGENLWNVRVIGNSSASSGNRQGVNFGGTTSLTIFDRMTIYGNVGAGWIYGGATAGVQCRITRSTIANNTGSGISLPNTASQTARITVDRCCITGNGAYGIDPGGANTNLIVTNCRLRDNATANFGTFGNFPTDMGNYTTDSDDATEYVNAASGDYRIKSSAAIWGKGYGVSDQAASGGVFIIDD